MIELNAANVQEAKETKKVVQTRRPLYFEWVKISQEEAKYTFLTNQWKRLN